MNRTKATHITWHSHTVSREEREQIGGHKGCTIWLTGLSGSGKSTLLAVLSGLLRPDDGAVGALGRDVWRMSEDEMERFRLRHCSYIFQGYNLFPALTAREQQLADTQCEVEHSRHSGPRLALHPRRR